MKSYYGRTFLGLAVVLVALVIAAIGANAAARDTRARYAALVQQDQQEKAAAATLAAKAAQLRHAMEPVSTFIAAWKAPGQLPEKDAPERIRGEIEAVAQRQLGLVTDNAITPPVDRHAFQGRILRVQRVTLRASGKDLNALVTWLGKVEETFPAALIEHCEYSSNVGGNTALTIRLVQPVTDGSTPRVHAAPATDPDSLPERIAMVSWHRYTPTALKRAIGVSFQRNPLQPAVAAEARPFLPVSAAANDVGPRLEAALTGKVRSVVRGTVPIVVVDGRVYRVGDELLLGSARERPIPEAKTKLKGIGEDRLVFHVAGGSAERPIQSEVAYLLPEFLKAR